MKKMLAVARWEYFDKVRRKSFWIGVLLLPVIIGLSALVPALLSQHQATKTKTIGVVDLTDSLAGPLQHYLNVKYALNNGGAAYTLLPLPVDASLPLDSIRSRCDRLTIAGVVKTYLLIPRLSDTAAVTIEYRGSSVANIRDDPRFEQSIQEVMLEQRLLREGVPVAAFRKAQRSVTLEPVEVSKSGEAKEHGPLQTFGVSYVLLILLMMMVMTSGQLLVRSMVEEKSNRIIEILFSSASPGEIMTGKVLGLSAVGITQVAILLVLGLAALLQTGFDLSTLQHIPLLMTYFVLGYIMYAALFVGAGSIATTEQEAQQITSYITLLGIFLPFLFIMSALQNPNDMLLVILSQIPIFTPSLMTIRIPVQQPALWEIALSLATQLLSIALIVKVSSKIFRIAMLMYGKRPTLKEIMRFAKS